MTYYDFFVGKMVRLDRGGHESRTGRLLYSGKDYLVLQTEKEGIIYYYSYHLKSISLNTKDNSDMYSEPVRSTEEPVPVLKYIKADSMQDVLSTMIDQWVLINRGGPESVQGVMKDVSSDTITLVSNHEIITMVNNHIRSCSYVVAENKEENNDKNNDNNGENKDDNNKGNDKKRKRK
ncbi:MAG: hypothetical protein WDZ91_00170 [Paenibacillaceae bacterium]